MELRIDPEFESKIPPLTEEEFRQLEDNILTDGLVINPIIVWNGVIVDGHNRFHIIEKHPEIKYTTHEKHFDKIVSEMGILFKEEADANSIVHSVFTALLDFAVRVYNGQLEDNELNRPHIFNVLYCMMRSYFKDVSVA